MHLLKGRLTVHMHLPAVLLSTLSFQQAIPGGSHIILAGTANEFFSWWQRGSLWTSIKSIAALDSEEKKRRMAWKVFCNAKCQAYRVYCYDINVNIHSVSAVLFSSWCFCLGIDIKDILRLNVTLHKAESELRLVFSVSLRPARMVESSVPLSYIKELRNCNFASPKIPL